MSINNHFLKLIAIRRMDVIHFHVLMLIFFNVLIAVPCKSEEKECPATYHQCTGRNWCCPEGLYCTGTSLCLSNNGIIVLVILSSVGLGILLAIVCVVYSKCTNNTNKTNHGIQARHRVIIPAISDDHHLPPYSIV